jgi:hypothetical protein
VRIDALLETFGSRWPEVHAGALRAERVGLDGVWLNDHLAGSVQGAPHVLECWTILSALAAEVPRMPSDRSSSTSATGIREHWQSWRRRCSTSAVAASWRLPDLDARAELNRTSEFSPTLG